MDMTQEEGAKMIISGGIVTSNQEGGVASSKRSKNGERKQPKNHKEAVMAIQSRNHLQKVVVKTFTPHTDAEIECAIAKSVTAF